MHYRIIVNPPPGWNTPIFICSMAISSIRTLKNIPEEKIVRIVGEGPHCVSVEFPVKDSQGNLSGLFGSTALAYIPLSVKREYAIKFCKALIGKRIVVTDFNRDKTVLILVESANILDSTH